jgi:hypothetical protein
MQGLQDTDYHDHERLLSPTTASPIELRPWWQSFHALCFATGGVTFIAGTACLFYPSWTHSALASAVLYIVGSLGFLGVDVQELFTYTSDRVLRINIALSASGSACYVIGSAGFVPVVLASAPSVGLAGFIAGSFLIGVSQLWKTYRYLTTSGVSEFERWTAIGVELDAGFGAWFFFAGTVMLATWPTATGSFLTAIYCIWMAGSIFFTLGALFLIYRHAVMHIS